ncbi:magnesium transporter [Ligilactobacillus equi]
MPETTLTTPEQKEEIISYLESQQAGKFRKAYLDLHVYEQAQIFSELDETQRNRIYRYLSPVEMGDMFNAIEEEPDQVVNYFKEMIPQYAADVIYEMYTDNAVDILAYAKAKDLNQYLELLPAEAAVEIRGMLHYQDKTAGAIMSTEYVAITGNQTVRSALHVMKKEALDAETIYYIYVIDDEENLQGVLTLRDLLTNDDDALISDIMNRPVMSVDVQEDQEEVAQTIRDYNFIALPVTNPEGKMIGIINVDDIIDVIDEESAQDYSGLAGVDVDNLPGNPWQAALKRLPWSLGLLILGITTAFVISWYQTLIQKDTLMVTFIAMVMGASGNAGTQSLAVSATRIADKDDEEESTAKMVANEALTGLIVGFFSGILFAVITGIWQQDLDFGLILGLALLIAVTISNVLGCLLPIIFKKLGKDASNVPGALVSTISDLLSALIYFGTIQIFWNLYH